MRRRILGPGVLSIAFLAATCSEQGSVPPVPNAPTGSLTAKPGTSVTVDFGRDDLGSEFPPPLGHDQSIHAKDKISPRNVVIDAGSTVTFRMGVSGVHQVAIYLPGTEPEDIRTVPPFLSPARGGMPARSAHQRSAEQVGGRERAGLRGRLGRAVVHVQHARQISGHLHVPSALQHRDVRVGHGSGLIHAARPLHAEVWGRLPTPRPVSD